MITVLLLLLLLLLLAVLNQREILGQVCFPNRYFAESSRWVPLTCAFLIYTPYLFASKNFASISLETVLMLIVNCEQMSAFFDLLFNLYILILSRCIIGNVRVANFAGAKNTNIVGYTKDFVIYRDAIGAQAD